MAEVTKRARRKANPGKPDNKTRHTFWTGSLSFGPVNVPVLVFPATKHSGVRLRMIGPDDAALARRYDCARDHRELDSDETVRGYELDGGSYVTVRDGELHDLEPQMTREIDLREFVDWNDVDSALLERGNYLTPQNDRTKAYRLLAEAMEKTGRAGIETFVMRDREYLVAIFAQSGILCAETLRFHYEIRDAEAIGLPAPVKPSRLRVQAFERSINALWSRTLPRELLADQDTRKLRTIVDKKIKASKDLIRATINTRDSETEDEDSVDMLETIRQSLRHTGKGRRKASRS